MKSTTCLLFIPALALLAHGGSIEVTYTDAAGTGYFDPTPRTPVGGNNGATLGEQRRIAFEYAAKRWADLINGPIPIKIRASFALTEPDGGNPPFLATATPAQFVANSSPGGPLPLDGTLYPTSLANQLTGEDTIVGGTRNDIITTANTYYETNGTDPGDTRRWYYGLDSNPPLAGSLPWFDFVGTMLHEIGHGLGITALVNADGSYSFAGQPAVWTRLIADGSGTKLTDMSQAARAAALTGNDLFVNSTWVVTYNNGSPAKVFAPNPLQPGSSTSHYDEATYSGTGSINELMTPAVSFGTQNIGPIVLNAMRDMGYGFLDALPPVVGIDVPVPGRAYRSSEIAGGGARGSATDTSSGGASRSAGLLRVKLALSDGATRFYDWTAGAFTSTTFNEAVHAKPSEVAGLVPQPTGSKQWTATLPTLPEGFYQLHVAAVDQLDQGSTYVVSDFTIDDSAPAVQIEPFVATTPVHDLSGLRVLAPDAQSVTVEIRRGAGPALEYWTGTNWSSTPTALPATQQGGRWLPSATLPGRADWPAGVALTIFTTATDAASNTTDSALTVQRTAADSSGPVVTMSSPANGVVLTQPVLPPVTGTAQDPETGIGSLSVIITRFLTGGGFEYWNGSSWVASPVSLPVHHDPIDGIWTAPADWNLPNGAFLSNGAYSIEIIASNREAPAATAGLGRTFTVDYHPVYTWTGWTMRDPDPDNNSD